MRHKSIWKTLSYRILSIVVTIILLRVFFDSWLHIGAYTLTSQVIKSLIYYGHEKLYKYIKKRRILNNEEIPLPLPRTNHPTTEQLLDFLRTITFNADYRGYMSAILTRVIAYKDIEELAIAYKKALKEKK